MSMLADAGIDVIFFDVTNAFTYLDVVKAMGDVMMQMRAEGNATPQISFLTHARGGMTQTQLYNEFYAKNLYPDLCYQREGKPFILGAPDAKMDDKAEMSETVKTYFSRRESWAWATPKGWYGDGKGKWPWLDNTPQQPGYSPDGKIEQMVVEVAQHPTTNKGKSFHNNQQPPVNEYGVAAQTERGLHFSEQWKRALEIDPPLVFLTQWNEWVAQRFIVDDKRKSGLMGRPLQPGESFFVDVYSAEYNRDIEPMEGGYTDSYYYQMIAGLRYFKGARPLPVASAPCTIAVDGDFAAWGAVAPEYRDTIGDTVHRDFKGADPETIYRNSSGRNDIVSAKVARDAETVYFTVQTREQLTPRTDPNWMMLFVDADRNPQTGWHGYDARVKDGNLERWQQNAWQRVGEARLAQGERQLELALPRTLFAPGNGPLSFDFKWGVPKLEQLFFKQHSQPVLVASYDAYEEHKTRVLRRDYDGIEKFLL